MESRRAFFKKAALLTGAAAFSNVIPMSIQQAMAIEPEPGTTFQDAEHVVFLMQENRSFDHLFGKLKGVRGFNDPRTFTLPDQNKVWLQKDKEGHTYAPFHVDINKTKITWQGGLPHSWSDQLAARNGGKYDQWVPVKSLMSMGYYDRSDVPFYYAMADAFTICDHNFCSSLTGTTPNRLFFWTGNVRPELNGSSVAVVNNSQAESREHTYVDWPTFPELLEQQGIDWKIYQNEIWTADLQGAEVDDWLGNYGDNAIEYVKRYQVRLSEYFRKNGDERGPSKLSPAQVREKYDRLSDYEKNLIDKAFATNINAPFNYLELAPFDFTDDEGKAQSINIPKNDIFYQFRQDVDTGKLPAVSWLVAPQRFSDHTSSPLYGTWYVSEALDILTKNPEVWKKTIFILTYDENDGYFDHIPPYVVPRPNDPESGKVSAGIDVAVDYESDKDSPIGLGYRVPLIVASPWSRGGYVNSEVFDHTSCLMFLENFLSKKTGKEIRSSQISSWRRNICGDLSSVFRPATASAKSGPSPLKKEATIIGIQNAKNKPAQLKPAALSESEIKSINTHLPFSPKASEMAAVQERGVSKACAIPYQLYAEAELDQNREQVALKLATSHGSLPPQIKTSGAPFLVYTKSMYRQEAGRTWNYAVKKASELNDSFKLADFAMERYNLCITAPNGFYREFNGSKADPALEIQCVYEWKNLLDKQSLGNIVLLLENKGKTDLLIQLMDNAYGSPSKKIKLKPGTKTSTLLVLKKSLGWYDYTLKVEGYEHYSRQYAGHVENGQDSITDPYMGGIL